MSWLRVRWFAAPVVGYLVVAVLIIGAVPREAWAIILPSDFSSSQRAEDLEKLQIFLESKVVRQRLADLGMSQQAVQTEVAQLSDQEIHRLAQHTELILPGGDGVEILLVLLLVAILVVLVLQITGHRIIITK